MNCSLYSTGPQHVSVAGAYDLLAEPTSFRDSKVFHDQRFDNHSPARYSLVSLKHTLTGVRARDCNNSIVLIKVSGILLHSRTITLKLLGLLKSRNAKSKVFVLPGLVACGSELCVTHHFLLD
jgi:hypothetical protein